MRICLKSASGLGLATLGHPENTPEGVLDQITEKGFYRYPDFNLNLGPSLTWEVDIWRKLRTAKEAARLRIDCSVRGAQFSYFQARY